MIHLEDLTPNTSIRGILPNELETVVSVQGFGSETLELTYKSAAGKVVNELIYRDDEPRLELVELGRPWSFDGDGAVPRPRSPVSRLPHLPRKLLPPKAKEGSWLTLDIVAGQPQNLKLDEKETDLARQRHESRQHQAALDRFGDTLAPHAHLPWRAVPGSAGVSRRSAAKLARLRKGDYK